MMNRRLLASFFVTTLVSSQLLAETSGTSPRVRGSVRIDCLHNSTKSKGSAQQCARISGLRLSYHEVNHSETDLALVVDPFGTPSQSLDHQAYGKENPIPSVSDSSLGVIPFYAIRWKFRSRLILGLETHGGAARLPIIHDLALGSRFQYAGWNQTALTATYHLGLQGDHKISFAIGNGEGEPTYNMDSQQYGAIAIDYLLFKGLHLAFGASFDGNSFGSESTVYVYGIDPKEAKAGFSNQRMSVAVYSDDLLEGLPGLKFSIGFQQSVAKDLDKKISFLDPSVFENNPRLSLRDLYIEDPTNAVANTVRVDVIDVSLRYALQAQNFLALNYETRSVSSSDVAFFADDANGTHKSLSQTGYGFGVGMALDDRLLCILEYRTESFNKDYLTFNYSTSDGKTSKTLDLFNARIAYAL